MEEDPKIYRAPYRSASAAEEGDSGTCPLNGDCEKVKVRTDSSGT